MNSPYEQWAVTKKTAGFLGFYPLSAAKRSANMEWAGGDPGENPAASWVFLVTGSGVCRLL